MGPFLLLICTAYVAASYCVCICRVVVYVMRAALIVVKPIKCFWGCWTKMTVRFCSATQADSVYLFDFWLCHTETVCHLICVNNIVEVMLVRVGVLPSSTLLLLLLEQDSKSLPGVLMLLRVPDLWPLYGGRAVKLQLMIISLPS